MQGISTTGKALRQPVMSIDEFLAWDATQDVRTELVGGEAFAMAGAEDRHVMVCGNVYMALRQRTCWWTSTPAAPTCVYRRNDAGLWVLHPFGPGEAVTLASVDLSIAFDQLFAEVDDDSDNVQPAGA